MSPTPCGGSDLLLGETYTLLSHLNDPSPAYETFCFDIEQKSSGSTTFHSDHSLSKYESFGFVVDHIEEKSSGSTTSHSDLSLHEYELFHFNLSIDPLPPTDRSDSHLGEFADELAHIISPLNKFITRWTIRTLLWKSISSLRKKKLIGVKEVYNWKTATYGKIWYNEDVHNLGSIETEFPAIVLNDVLTSKVTLSCEPTEPSERNDNVGGVFINLEISKCWSLEIPRRLFNTLFAHELNLENHS
ncbi:hypothetical protein Tco_0886485 [Tanacetum coccineum]